jgi:hypothetical protein
MRVRRIEPSAISHSSAARFEITAGPRDAREDVVRVRQ